MFRNDSHCLDRRCPREIRQEERGAWGADGQIMRPNRQGSQDKTKE